MHVRTTVLRRQQENSWEQPKKPVRPAGISTSVCDLVPLEHPLLTRVWIRGIDEVAIHQLASLAAQDADWINNVVKIVKIVFD